MLDGSEGEAKRMAMRILARAAAIDGAPELIPVTQAHIDAVTYIGPGGLKFAEKLADLGGQVSVPTTLNSNSIDRQQWQELRISPSLGRPAKALGDAYLRLGCTNSFTCAPYLLDSAPGHGDQVAWGESNAVVFANSVLGARTQKYADYLDICAALTGRVPKCGPHLSSNRIATTVLEAGEVADQLMDLYADAFWPTLGYLVGMRSGPSVCVVDGLQDRVVSRDDLKAFSAAFGTTGSEPMFHMAGITPEAPTLEQSLDHKTPAHSEVLTRADMEEAWAALDSSSSESVDLVAVGNPHLSLSECKALAELVQDGGRVHPDVKFYATMGREIKEQADAQGYTSVLEGFGVRFITDTCWCMLTEPVVPVGGRTLITNSGKYAHYAPGLVNRQVRFSNMAGVVSAARSGLAPPRPTYPGVRTFASLAFQVLKRCR